MEVMFSIIGGEQFEVQPSRVVALPAMASLREDALEQVFPDMAKPPKRQKTLNFAPLSLEHKQDQLANEMEAFRKAKEDAKNKLTAMQQQALRYRLDGGFPGLNLRARAGKVGQSQGQKNGKTACARLLFASSLAFLKASISLSSLSCFCSRLRGAKFNVF